MKYFGTDGIRGLFGHPPLTSKDIAHIGYHILKVLDKKNPVIVVGYDTRATCLEILEGLLEGFRNHQDINPKVYDVGVAPTPAVSYLTKEKQADIGIMISASHNSFEYNGLKLFNPSGAKLSLAEEEKFEKAFHNPCFLQTKPKVVQTIDAQEWVQLYTQKIIDDLSPFKKVRIVLDCANGAFYKIAPLVCEKLGLDVLDILDNSPDGYNINISLSKNFSDLKEAILKHKADFGLSFDGDGDRVLIFDHDAQLIDGDQMLACLASTVANVKGVVGTLLSNQGLRLFLASKKIPFVETHVGDRFVSEAMVQKGFLIGGEPCGHVVFAPHLKTGDGLYIGLKVIKAAISLKKKQVFPIFTAYPSVSLNVALHQSFENLFSNTLIATYFRTQKKKCEEGQKGRLIVRPSGTEPLVRIFVEHVDLCFAKTIAHDLANFIQSAQEKMAMQPKNAL